MTVIVFISVLAFMSVLVVGTVFVAVLGPAAVGRIVVPAVVGVGAGHGVILSRRLGCGQRSVQNRAPCVPR
jgi:hypothetical protein